MIIKRYEEKLSDFLFNFAKLKIFLEIQKQEFNQEINDKLDKTNEEKALIEAKYEKSRKALKEIEAIYNKQLSQLEKEKAIVQEKLFNTEGKKSETEKKSITDSLALGMQISQLKETFSNEKKQLILSKKEASGYGRRW